jgi:hypothetical protein
MMIVEEMAERYGAIQEGLASSDPLVASQYANAAATAAGFAALVLELRLFSEKSRLVDALLDRVEGR